MEDIKQSKRRGFTQMSLKTLKAIVSEGGGHNDMATYIVLCSGVNSKQKSRVCTHGAQSVCLRTGISYRTAQKSIEWLLEKGFYKSLAVKKLEVFHFFTYANVFDRDFHLI